MSEQPNASTEPLSGWKIWWRLTGVVGGFEALSCYQSDSFTACPKCGGPNVLVTAIRTIPDKLKHRPARLAYVCIGCKSRGRIEADNSVPEGAASAGEQRRRHNASMRVWAFFLALVLATVVLFVVGLGGPSAGSGIRGERWLRLYPSLLRSSASSRALHSQKLRASGRRGQGSIRPRRIA